MFTERFIIRPANLFNQNVLGILEVRRIILRTKLNHLSSIHIKRNNKINTQLRL